MESINDVLEDCSITETKKLEMINLLLDKQTAAQSENINLRNILNITTENVELKRDVLRKVFVASRNFEENVNYIVEYFTKTFIDCKNHNLLGIILILMFERFHESDRIQNVIKQLDIEKINEVILKAVFSHKIDDDEWKKIFKVYLIHLSIEQQSMFLSTFLKFSKLHQTIDFLSVTLENMPVAALTHETSVLRTEDFWNYLLNYLDNCMNFLETQKAICVLSMCTNLVQNTKLDFQFLCFNHDEKPWNAFLALVQVFNYGNRELIKLALGFLKYISQLHFFWQYWILKFLVKRASRDLKCEILVLFLKQPIKDDNLQDVFKIIFTAINEQKCINKDCPVFKELKYFCENLNVRQFPLILDEILNVSWNAEQMVSVISNVLIDSKKTLIDFGYFHRFEALLNKVERDSHYFWPDEISTIIHLFWASECSKNPSEDIAMEKILNLSEKSIDNTKEIETYLGFLHHENYIKIIKEYPLSIHTRMAVYKRLFNMGGYYIAQNELDQEKTITDFYEYLTKSINEKTYRMYTDLMIYFLDLNGRFMHFAYPEKACLEILNIMRKPELYTNYQIYCAAEILRVVDFRFDQLLRNTTEEQEYYKAVAEKWKYLVLDTDDDGICKEGLYYVLKKVQLNAKEYNDIVKKLLGMHLCDDVAKEIYREYLEPDLMNFAFKRLNDIKEYNLRKYDHFSKLFCEAVVSGKYITSNKFSCENEEYKFCCLNSENLEYSIREIDYTFFDYIDYIECRGIMIDLTIEIYLSELSNLQTKVYCLHVFMKIVSKQGYFQAPPTPFHYFNEDAKLIMARFKDKYAANLKNDVIKLRIVQALFLVIPFILRDFNFWKYKQIARLWKVNVQKKLRNSLKRIAVGILVKESDSKNNAVRQICQYMYILLSQRDTTFEEIKCIIEKIKEQPNLACSFIPVLYHVMPFCNFSENETEEIVASMFLLLPTSDEKLRVYAQILLHRISILYNDGIFKNIIEQYTSRLEQINLDIESNKNEITDILKTDYVFLKVLDPIRDHSLETVLYILPKLNQVVSGEWKGIMRYDLIYFSSINKFTIKKDENESLKKSVEEFLKAQELANNEYVNYCAEDILEWFKVSSENFNLTRRSIAST